ncbi:hypothetical protein QTV49_004673 [Vibrio vulnificus]|nr:hypothetical protein [Vibrio vulnificus]
MTTNNKQNYVAVVGGSPVGGKAVLEEIKRISENKNHFSSHRIKTGKGDRVRKRQSFRK